MRPLPRLYPLLLCLAALAGCASTKDYTSAAPKNLTVRADTESGFFHQAGAQLGIYVFKSGSKCELDYLGTVELEGKPVRVGLETGRKTVLRFVVGLSDGGNTTTIPWVTTVTPRPGAQYAAKVRYADGMYEVTMQELNSRGGVVREFERQPAPPCAPE